MPENLDSRFRGNDGYLNDGYSEKRIQRSAGLFEMGAVECLPTLQQASAHVFRQQFFFVIGNRLDVGKDAFQRQKIQRFSENESFSPRFANDLVPGLDTVFFPHSRRNGDLPLGGDSHDLVHTHPLVSEHFTCSALYRNSAPFLKFLRLSFLASHFSFLNWSICHD
jgi:hypothetical protein